MIAVFTKGDESGHVFVVDVCYIISTFCMRLPVVSIRFGYECIEIKYCLNQYSGVSKQLL